MDCSQCPDNQGQPRKPGPWCEHPCADWQADEIDRVYEAARERNWKMTDYEGHYASQESEGVCQPTQT
jgi:hypothetical protein